MHTHWSQFVPDMSTRHPRTLRSTSSASCSCFFCFFLRVLELCESRGGRPGLPDLMSLMVSMDVKQQRTMLRHWSQFVHNMSTRHPRTLSSTSSTSFFWLYRLNKDCECYERVMQRVHVCLFCCASLRFALI